YLWPVILVFCMIGTYATTNSIFTVIVMMAAGVFGVLCKRLEIPAGPIVLGLLLGPIAEENLARALVLQHGNGFFDVWSPIALGFLALALGSLLLPLLRRRTPAMTGLETPPADGPGSTPAGDEAPAATPDQARAPAHVSPMTTVRRRRTPTMPGLETPPAEGPGSPPAGDEAPAATPDQARASESSSPRT